MVPERTKDFPTNLMNIHFINGAFVESMEIMAVTDRWYQKGRRIWIILMDTNTDTIRTRSPSSLSTIGNKEVSLMAFFIFMARTTLPSTKNMFFRVSCKTVFGKS